MSGSKSIKQCVNSLSEQIVIYFAGINFSSFDNNNDLPKRNFVSSTLIQRTLSRILTYGTLGTLAWDTRDTAWWRMGHSALGTLAWDTRVTPHNYVWDSHMGLSYDLTRVLQECHINVTGVSQKWYGTVAVTGAWRESGGLTTMLRFSVIWSSEFVGPGDNQGVFKKFVVQFVVNLLLFI